MEKLRATLEVEEVSGKRGPFNVGKLLTSIGVFKVTDKRLDQFTPGSYAGEFLIEHLRTKQVDWRDGTFTYIQAIIADEGFLIDEEDQYSAATGPVQAEPDPPDLDDDGHMPIAPVAPVPPSAAQHRSDKPAGDEPDDEAIFGIELYPLFARRQSPISLDTSVERRIFKLQHARLKAAGYRFVSQGQHWILECQS
jgi:hypothetical protein